MGKRSAFERRDRDFYPTPASAVLPLIPHLSGQFYAEPCAGDQSLVRHLDEHGLMCVWASDIERRHPEIDLMDALDLTANHFPGADYIITNPPWTRDILHPMIRHFSAILPTWLLFDADWMHTRQSAEFMPLLRKVVSVGRVKWIPDSKMTGKDNCAWHLFDANAEGKTVFVGRAA